MAKKKQKEPLTLDEIRASEGRSAEFIEPEYLYLCKPLNKVIARPVLGLRYGAMVEIFGEFSCGKSAISEDICAVHQDEDELNEVVWGDLENSFEQPIRDDERTWPQKRGLICHKGDKALGISGTQQFHLLQPYARLQKKKVGNKVKIVRRLTTAEQLLAEGIDLIERRKQDNPRRKFIFVIDSVAALQAETAVLAEADEASGMKTKLSTASMLSSLLPRWSGLGPALQCTFIFINQIRMRPGVMYGSPEYTPGGKALPFFAHARVEMKRFGKKSRIAGKNGVQIGITGVMKAVKNKLGGKEYHEIGYRILNNGSSEFFELD